jgi:hypothetical protein
MTVLDGAGNQNPGWPYRQNASGPDATPEPGTGLVPEPGADENQNRDAAGSPEILGPVLRCIARLVLKAARGAGAELLRLAETPGHPLHRAYQYQPMTLAEHHVHANSHEGAARFQLHTTGRALNTAGNGLSALGASVPGQCIAGAVLILVAIAIAVLVL